MNPWWKQLWLSVRQNKYFVAFEGGASGAVLNYAYDMLNTGHLDFSKQGIGKLIVTALTGGVTALRLLYRPAPGSNPTP